MEDLLANNRLSCPIDKRINQLAHKTLKSLALGAVPSKNKNEISQRSMVSRNGRIYNNQDDEIKN